MEKPNLNVEDKSKLVDQEPIKESFINILTKIHKMDRSEAESVFEREAMYYKKLLFDNAWLKESTGLSLYSSFLEIAITGLSIQPGSKSEAFLEARQANQPKDGKDNWVKVCRLVVSAYGELNMRIKAGQIIRINNPIVFYEGDHFQPKTNSRGELMVDYAPAIPRKKDAKIMGVWCAIILPHNGIDFKWLLEEDIERLRKFSIPKKQNATANALYSSNSGQIDTGFLEAKCIKHAMRAYTKLKVSDNIAFEGDEAEPEVAGGFAPPKNDVQTVTVVQPTEEDESDIF